MDTIVTVEFHERGKQTEVVLRHEGLTDPESRGRHEAWVELVLRQSRHDHESVSGEPAGTVDRPAVLWITQ